MKATLKKRIAVAIAVATLGTIGAVVVTQGPADSGAVHFYHASVGGHFGR